MSAATTVTLLGRPGCHLCDEAREVVLPMVDEFPTVVYRERSIVDDPALLELYAEEIPVVLINRRVHTIWRVDQDRFRAALTEAIAAQ